MYLPEYTRPPRLARLKLCRLRLSVICKKVVTISGSKDVTEVKLNLRGPDGDPVSVKSQNFSHRTKGF